MIIHLGALGAVLRSTSLVSAIKRIYPQSHITWVTDTKALPLITPCSKVDRALPSDFKGQSVLRTLRFDYTFIVDKSLEAYGLSLLPIHSGLKRGFGVDPQTGSILPLNPEAEELWKLGLDNQKKFFVNKKPETQLVVEAMGLNYKDDPYILELTEGEKGVRERMRLQLCLGNSKPIGLNTGCSNTLVHKKFSHNSWLEVIDSLHAKFPNNPLVLLGGSEDAERNQNLKFARPYLIETPTDGGLRMGMVATDLCEYIVTGDSLGMHLAIGLGKKIVAWFGPTCAHEIDFYGKGVAVRSHKPCSPCWNTKCDVSEKCSEKIEVQQITLEMRKLIRPGPKLRLVRQNEYGLDGPEI